MGGYMVLMLHTLARDNEALAAAGWRDRTNPEDDTETIELDAADFPQYVFGPDGEYLGLVQV